MADWDHKTAKSGDGGVGHLLIEVDVLIQNGELDKAQRLLDAIVKVRADSVRVTVLQALLTARRAGRKY
jgi:hypothetical protein